MRINVSNGPKPVAVPTVVGLATTTGSSAAPGARASRSRESTSTATSPRASSSTRSRAAVDRDSKGSTVTLSVSKGRRRPPLPDVTGQTVANAQTTLEAAGFGDRVDAGHRRGDVRRHRDLAGSRRGTPSRTEHDRDALRRRLRPPPTRRRPTRRRPTRRRRPDPVSGRVRVAVLAGGRSSEHEISLASARSVLDALDPDALRDARRSRSAGTARWALPPAPDQAALPGASAGSLPRPDGARRPPALGAVDVVLPDPARALRRGRHRAGAARARRRPLRRRGRGGVGALHGQGPLQGRAARPRDPGGAERHAPRRATRSRIRSATRCS